MHHVWDSSGLNSENKASGTIRKLLSAKDG